MINDCVSPWPPPWMVIMGPNIKVKPGSPNRPIEVTWPIPALINQRGPRPITGSEVIVVVDITIERPSRPVIIIEMTDYLNSGWFLLEILNLNEFYIEAVFTLSHDMEL